MFAFYSPMASVGRSARRVPPPPVGSSTSRPLTSSRPYGGSWIADRSNQDKTDAYASLTVKSRDLPRWNRRFGSGHEQGFGILLGDHQEFERGLARAASALLPTADGVGADVEEGGEERLAGIEG